jgi:hypothetical protein
MNTPLLWISVVVIGGGIVFAGHRLLVWMEQKGWIFYRKSGNPSGALGNAFMAVHSMLDSESGRAAEHRLHEEKEEPEAGEPPVPGE